MLRTRRRDNNVKPNRRLDRKSSRGMLYENEELRLKTININAEIERGQSDIKKLKRENEMLKKEIWCLRDEYDKLDKLLKEKKIDFSSSSTTYSSSSDSESCSSCTEEPEEVETSQNLKNVQKSHLKTIHDQFDHLSIVTEEASCENSDKNSMNTRHSMANDQKDNMLWTYGDKEAIKPDQSYPIYGMAIESSRSQTLPNQQHQNDMNFFAPIQHSKSFDDNHFNQVHQGPLYPEELYRQTAHCHNDEGSPTPPVAVSPTPPPLYENQQVVFQERDNAEAENFLSKKIVHTDATNFYQNVVLVPPNPNQPLKVPSMEKKATDLIVKIDNQNFAKNLTYSNTTPSTTFSNGGNLEELLQDIESISQRGNAPQLPTIHEPPHGTSSFQEQTHFDQQIHQRDLTYLQNPVMDHLMTMKNPDSSDTQLTGSQERLHKSELNVVLMPKAMPLIGFDKYKNIQRSLESLTSKNLDNMSASQQNLCVIPPSFTDDKETVKLHVNLPPRPPTPSNFQDPSSGYPITSSLPTGKDHQDQNPFFFGHLTDNYVNSDYFSRRYNPENFKKEDNSPAKVQQDDPGSKQEEVHKHHHTPVENEENIKLKTSNPSPDGKETKQDKKQKSPKMSITKKVSIHFKGKKEKERLKKLVLDGNPDIRLRERKSSIFEWKNNGEVVKESATPKSKPSKHGFHQKTPSIESKKSTTETSNNAEPKTPNSSESEKKKEAKKEEKKGRKSVSISPDRARHVHLMHDGMKKHKKHSRRSGGSRVHRGSADPRAARERSYSICTDRSMMGPGLGLGLGYGSFMYDDYSDRERTNSGSSCDSHDNHRKMSAISNVVVTGKVPWCGCWGNGCL